MEHIRFESADEPKISKRRAEKRSPSFPSDDNRYTLAASVLIESTWSMEADDPCVVAFFSQPTGQEDHLSFRPALTEAADDEKHPKNRRVWIDHHAFEAYEAGATPFDIGELQSKRGDATAVESQHGSSNGCWIRC